MAGIDIAGDDSAWEDNIKIYTLDSFVAGNDIATPTVDGDSNIPLRQLANRTSKIKNILDKLGIYVKDSEFKHSGQNVIYNAPIRGDVVSGECVSQNTNQFWRLDQSQTDSRSKFVGIADKAGSRVITSGLIEIANFAARGYTPGDILYATGNVGAIVNTYTNIQIGRYLYDDIILISNAETQEGAQLKVDAHANRKDDPHSLQDEISVSTLAVVYTTYFVDTSGGPLILTLPLNPILFNRVSVVDENKTFDFINKLTIGRNGKKIQSLDEDMTVNTRGVSFDLVYMGATKGWCIA